MSKGFRIDAVNDTEVALAFHRVGTETRRLLRPALKKAAEPVRAEAASRFARYDPRSAAGYKVRVRARGVAVEQSLKRTTGLHPQFGSLQMRQALLPALAEKGDAVRDEIGVMVDMVGIKAGF